MVLRRAKVSAINQLTGIASIEYNTEGVDQASTDVRVTQPFAGRGWGVLAGIEIDTIVIVDSDFKDKPYISGYLPDDRFFPGNQEEKKLPTAYDLEPKFKTLKEGELVLQSRANSLVFLDQRGNVSLSTSDGSLFELNKNNDSINQISVNHSILTEATSIRNGLIKRDIRSEQEKIDDLFLTSLLATDFSAQETLDIIGANSEHSIPDESPLVGTFDPTDGELSILKIPGLKGVPKTEKMIQKIKNPALTEYRIDVNEFSDGVSSLNLLEDSDNLKQGRLPLNLAARLTLGTVVDENGRMPRFDYVFGTGEGKGHKDIWKLTGVNDTNNSVDFKVNPDENIKSITSLGNKTQWISSGIDKFNTALAFQLLLNTRGADHKGKIPTATSTGSIWGLQVDKEGLTKWNIPASTAMGEHFRNGRSLLWNLDGSLTQSVGKEDNSDLPSITGKNNSVENAKFVNVVETRKERSWTADFEGTVEWRMGADFAGQSWMVHADGGHSFYYGKYKHTEPSIVSKIATSGLASPSKSGKRIGTSISGRTEGSVEFDIGANEANNKQSIALNADGMMSITIGADKVKDSLILDTAGNIKFKVLSGGHKFEMLSAASTDPFKNAIMIQHGGATGSVIQIDSNGVIMLRNAAFNANIIISAQGAISMINPAGKISLGIDGSVGLGGALAGIDISPTTGVTLRTPGGSISLNTIGKVEMAANTGFTVTGPFAHLNTTGVLLSPGAALSPFSVAASGPGFLDPLTGHFTGGFLTIKA